MTKKIVALIAALALTVPLAACGTRDRAHETGQPPQTTTTAPTQPADPAAIQKALDDLDGVLGDVDSSLTEADTAPADAD